MYISKPHCKEPRRDSINLYYDGRLQTPGEGHWRGIVACSTDDMMKVIKERFGATNEPLDGIERCARDPRFLLRYSKEVIAQQACGNLSSISSSLDKIVSHHE